MQGVDMNKGVAFCLDNICVQNQLFPSEADEPPPGDVAGIEGCREWAEFWMVDGVVLFHCDVEAICICICLQVAFFHYDSITEECQLYRTMEADCQAMGAPKTAPSFEECTTTTTTATTTTTSKR